MRIAIDGYEANVVQRLGSSQVAFELLKNLEKIDKKNEYIIFLQNAPLDDLPKERMGWQYKILKPSKLWTRIALPLALYTTKKKPDLIFSPTHYIPRFSPVKRVVTIFDLSFLHFPEMFERGDLYKLKNWTKYSAQTSDHIITISNFSKLDIVKQYFVSKNKITVSYPGFNSEVYKVIKDIKKISAAQKKYKTGQNYIIYIGTIQPRKNLVRLIEAFAKLAEEKFGELRDQLKLVIVGKTTGPGKSGWMYEDILQRPKQLQIEDKVIFTGFVPTEDLVFLLNGSRAFVLPSLWEGFGIPVVDAMACGVPVVVSNISSLPEVVGDAGLLFDPYSKDQIEQAIRMILTDKKLANKLINLCLERSKKFSWEKMAKDVLKVFKGVANE